MKTVLFVHSYSVVDVRGNFGNCVPTLIGGGNAVWIPRRRQNCCFCPRFDFAV